jgi:hypothetical protein
VLRRLLSSLLLAAAFASTAHAAVFHNRLGWWQISPNCPGGYVSRLVLPDGRVATDDGRREPSNARNVALNNPAWGGIGEFGYLWAKGGPPYVLWHTADARSLASCQVRRSRALVTPTTYEQAFVFPEAFALHVYWRFAPSSVELVAWIATRISTVYVKEPKFVIDLNGAIDIRLVRVLGSDCKPYRVSIRSDPRRSTGHCTDHARTGFEVGPLRFWVHEDGLRQLGAAAQHWASAGLLGCGWRNFGPSSWEFTSWGPNAGTDVLMKSWDGCVTPLDAWRFYRRSPGVGLYRFALVIARAH